MRVPVGGLHAGMYALPSRPVEDGEAARRGGAEGRGRSGGRSNCLQEHKERGDYHRKGSKGGSVSPPSQETQRVMTEIMGSECFCHS